MPAPQLFFQFGKPNKQLPCRSALQCLHHVGNEMLRRCTDEQVNVIWHHFQRFNANFMLSCNLGQQHLEGVGYFAFQHGMAVVDAPYEVVLNPVNIPPAALQAHKVTVPYVSRKLKLLWLPVGGEGLTHV